MLRSLAVLGLALVTSPAARAACTMEILRPTRAIPSAAKGQWFEFLASDCASFEFVFSANGGAFIEEATFIESTDDGDLYQVRVPPMYLGSMMQWHLTVLNWSITGFGVRPSEMVRVSTTSELDTDRDGWTRSDGDVGTCDRYSWINPGVAEICDNGLDDDCDGEVDC